MPLESLTNKYIKDLEPFDIYIPTGRIKFLDKDLIKTKSPAFGSVILKLNGENKWFRI